MISFDIGLSGQSLAFSDSVLEHFNQHRQARFWQNEAGGLLFARFQLPVINIDVATGPRRGDQRSRYSYRPDERAEQREINEMFSRGLHFVAAGIRTQRISHRLRISTAETLLIACAARTTR